MISFTYQEIGILILFVTGILAGLWLGFLLGLNSLPPVPIPPGDKKPGAFIKLGFEEFD